MLPAPPRPCEAIGSVISVLRFSLELVVCDHRVGTVGRLGVRWGKMVAVTSNREALVPERSNRKMVISG